MSAVFYWSGVVVWSVVALVVLWLIVVEWMVLGLGSAISAWLWRIRNSPNFSWAKHGWKVPALMLKESLEFFGHRPGSVTIYNNNYTKAVWRGIRNWTDKDGSGPGQ